MRITYKVFLVGGIPITIAAAIALAAFVLLNEADRARTGAVLAGTIYRNLLSAGPRATISSTRARGERTRDLRAVPDLYRAGAFRPDAALRRGARRGAASKPAKEAMDALQRYSDDMRRLST